MVGKVVFGGVRGHCGYIGRMVLAVTALVLQLAAHADSVARAQVDSGFSGVVLLARGDSVLLERAYQPSGARRLSARTREGTMVARAFPETKKPPE